MHSIFRVLLLLYVPNVVEASIFHVDNDNIDIIKQSTSTSCTNYFEYTNNVDPNAFTGEFYDSYRQTCTDKCNVAGFCCTKAVAGCEKVPCNEGCHIAFFSTDVAACKAECERANSSPDCSYLHNKHSQVYSTGDFYSVFFPVGEIIVPSIIAI